MSIPTVKALVPMKEHSERVPRKNFRPIGGKPCFHWIMEALSKAKHVDEIIINTDSEIIAKDAKENFDVTILERPDYLKGDHVSIQPLIEYDLANSGGEFYLQTHSSNPLLKSETIDGAIEAFFAQSEHDALFSITEIQERYYWPDGRPINHDPSHLIRTQDLDPIYLENSCMYIFSKATNMQHESRLGSNPMMYPIGRLEATDIDNIEDFLWAEFLIERMIKGELE